MRCVKFIEKLCYWLNANILTEYKHNMFFCIKYNYHHFSFQSKSGASVGTLKNVFCCDICSKEFQKKKASLTMHIRIAHWNKRFECDVCGVRLKYRLQEHMRICHGNNKSQIKAFECDVCGICSDYKRDLIRHIRALHHGIKSQVMAFECEMCKVY